MSPATAQDCMDYWTEEYKRNQGCISDAPDNSGGNDYVAPAPDPAARQRAIDSAEAVRLQDQGVAALNSGSNAGALALLEQAMRLSPDDPIIARNLQTARERVQAEQQAKRDEDARRAATQQRFGHLSDTLKTIRGAAVGTGLDFDSGTASVGAAKDSTALSFSPVAAPTSAPACGVVTDSMVVDACSVVPWGSDLPKVAEIERSPGAVPARRGLEAIANHNWPLALAMYGTALHMDPNNAALKRAVDMAQYMSDWHAKNDQPQRALAPSIRAIERRDAAGAQAAIAQVKQLHPEWAPKDSDVQFLFDGLIKPPVANSEDAKFDKDIFSPGGPATGTAAERQRTMMLSVAQELHEEAYLELMLGDRSGFDKKVEQSKAVWRASKKLREASAAK